MDWSGKTVVPLATKRGQWLEQPIYQIYRRLKSTLACWCFRLGLAKVLGLSAAFPIKLHLGCGDRYAKGFLNLDLVSATADINADCVRLGFLKDRSVSYILVEHMLEHLSRREGLSALKEWARLLIPGGIVEIEVPDVVWCLENFLGKTESERYDGEYMRQGAIAAIYGMQTDPGHFHKFGYTKEYLIECLKVCGFGARSVKTYMSFHPCRSIRVTAVKDGHEGEGNSVCEPLGNVYVGHRHLVS